MPIPFTCPHCGLVTSVADQYAGQSGPCLRCGGPITVPPLGYTPFGYPPPARPASSRLPTVIMVGVVVVGVLMVAMCGGVVLSVVGAAKTRATRNLCVNNLKQIGLAMHNYHMDYGCFPPAYVADAKGRPMHSWRVLLLPYLDQKPLYDRYRFNEPWNSPHNLALTSEMPSVYRCPDAHPGDDSSTTDYGMIVGPGMFSNGKSATRIVDIPDGLPNTIMVVEVAESDIPWTKPEDLDARKIDFRVDGGQDKGIGGNHADGPRALFADGSVRPLAPGTSPNRVKAMATIAGQEKEAPEDLPDSL